MMSAVATGFSNVSDPSPIRRALDPRLAQGPCLPRERRYLPASLVPPPEEDPRFPPATLAEPASMKPYPTLLRHRGQPPRPVLHQLTGHCPRPGYVAVTPASYPPVGKLMGVRQWD